MKVKVKRTELLNAAKTAAKAVRKSPAEVMNCLKLSFADGLATVTGASQQMTCISTIDAETEGSFALAVDATLIQSVLAKLPTDYVVLSKTDDEGFITAGKSTLSVALIPLDTWMQLPEVSDENAITVAAEDLQESVNACLHAIGGAGAENVLTGSLDILVSEESGVKVTALDGHRVAIRDTISSDQYKEILVQGELMRDVCTLLSDAPVSVSSDVDRKSVEFVQGNKKLIVSQTNGSFYNIQNLLDTSRVTTTVTVSRSEFLSELEIAMAVKKDAHKSFELTIENGVVKLNAKEANTKYATDITTKKVEGDDLRIGCNARLLSDALKNVPEEEVTIAFSGTRAPIIIRGEGYTEIVLPIALQ